MKSQIFIIFFLLLTLQIAAQSFKQEQKKYPRVRTAYAEKETEIKNLLLQNGLNTENLRVYIRAFKLEKKLELWAKNTQDTTYKLLQKYDICLTSGRLGPKRKQGDLQIPEGFYHISRFNPYSNFYLSLGINYPNASDRILSDKTAPGGDIFIHGDCVTIGCIPITNDYIKELYLICIDAKNSGQDNIPVTIFPSRLDRDRYDALCIKYNDDKDRLALWSDLKNGYDIFNRTKQLPNIVFLANGRHTVTE